MEPISREIRQIAQETSYAKELGSVPPLQAIKKRVEADGERTRPTMQAAAYDAAQNGWTEAVFYLLDNTEARLHEDDDNILRSAIKNKHTSLAHKLLERGANPDVLGGQPFMYAGRANDRSLLRRVDVEGINPDLRNGYVLRMALEDGATKTIPYLLEHYPKLYQKRASLCLDHAIGGQKSKKVLSVLVDYVGGFESEFNKKKLKQAIQKALRKDKGIAQWLVDHTSFNWGEFAAQAI